MASRSYQYTARYTYNQLYDIEVGLEPLPHPSPGLSETLDDRLRVAVESFDEPNGLSNAEYLRESLAAHVSDTMRKLGHQVEWCRVTAAGSGVVHRIET